MVQSSVQERAANAGAVSPELLSAFRAVLSNTATDGGFVAAALALPSVTELVGDVEDADPLLLHLVCPRPSRVHHGLEASSMRLTLSFTSSHI